jgi:CspA family cold shock protein
MARGVIKKIVTDRGFGFIAGERQDVFFHHSSVADRAFDQLQIGQSVEYELEADDERRSGKGPRAAAVTPV